MNQTININDSLLEIELISLDHYIIDSLHMMLCSRSANQTSDSARNDAWSVVHSISLTKCYKLIIEKQQFLPFKHQCLCTSAC
jgi:hypothetical protein